MSLYLLDFSYLTSLHFFLFSAFNLYFFLSLFLILFLHLSYYTFLFVSHLLFLSLSFSFSTLSISLQPSQMQHSELMDTFDLSTQPVSHSCRLCMVLRSRSSIRLAMGLIDSCPWCMAHSSPCSCLCYCLCYTRCSCSKFLGFFQDSSNWK